MTPYHWVICRVVINHNLESKAPAWVGTRSRWTLCSGTALFVPLWETSLALSWGSARLWTCAKSCSRALCCGVDRNSFLENVRMSPGTAISGRLRGNKLPSCWNSPGHAGGLCLLRPPRNPCLLTYLCPSCGGKGGGLIPSVLHPTPDPEVHVGKSETCFPWPLALTSPSLPLLVFTRRRDLDFNVDLSAFFLLPGVVLTGRLQLLIYQIYKMLVLPRSLGTWTSVKILTSNDNKKKSIQRRCTFWRFYISCAGSLVTVI